METRVSKIERLRQVLEVKVRSLKFSVEQLTQLAIESEELHTLACTLRTAHSARQSLVSRIHTALTHTVLELQILEQEDTHSDLNRTFSRLQTLLQTHSGRKRRKVVFSVTAS